MSSKTDIEWTGENGRSWNMILGCDKKSKGCQNCYALTMSARVANQGRVRDNPTKVQKAYQKIVKYNPEKEKYEAKWNGKIVELPDRLQDPIRWQKPSIVFVNSMSDLFHPEVKQETIDRVFAAMALAPRHYFLILTKRPKRMMKHLRRTWAETLDGRVTGPMAAATFWFDNIENARQKVSRAYGNRGYLLNVGVGTSIESQEVLHERILPLVNTPADMKFLSCEPLIGPLDLSNHLSTLDRIKAQLYNDPHAATLLQDSINEGRADGPMAIDWVITGGESGHHARPMKPAWEHEIRVQCQEHDVAYFFKQYGAWIDELHPDFKEDSLSQHGYWNGDKFFTYDPGNSLPQGGLVMQKQGLKNPPGPDRLIHKWPKQIHRLIGDPANV